uniref:Uncharacterized protein n=2 Tax=Caenorhabditis japonica TaxID=281687 RepID=A0A8R1I8M4_CAEJA
MEMVCDLKKMIGARVDAKVPINPTMYSNKPMHHRKLHRHHPMKLPSACHRPFGTIMLVQGNCLPQLPKEESYLQACHSSRATSPNGSIRTNTVVINRQRESSKMLSSMAEPYECNLKSGSDVTLISHQDCIKLQKPSLHTTKGTLRSVNNKTIKDHSTVDLMFLNVPEPPTQQQRLNAVHSSRLEPSRARTISTARLQLPPNAKPFYRKTCSMSSAAITLIKEEREHRQHRHQGRTSIEYNNEMCKHQSSPTSMDSVAANQHQTTVLSTAAFEGPDVPRKPTRHRRKAARLNRETEHRTSNCVNFSLD